MRTRTRTILVACAAAAAAAALGVMCAPPMDFASSALMPPAVGACQAYAISRCERMDACTGGAWTAQFFGSRAACEQHVGDACTLRASAPGMSITASNIDACTAALSDASCADFFGGIAACHLQPGTLAIDEPCTYPLQCASAWCDRAAGSGCGVCATRPSAPPASVPCGTTTCTAPAFCMMGRCAIPIASYASTTREGGPIEGLAPLADARLAGGLQIALDQQCEGGCDVGFTCLGIIVPSVSDPSQRTTRFGCAPLGSDPLACTHAGLVLDLATGECEQPTDTILVARYAAPTRVGGPIDGLAPGADPRLAASIEVAVEPLQCAGGCDAGFTCLSITVPSVSDPSQTTTRFGCAPVASAAEGATPTARFPTPSRTAGSIEGLAPSADPSLANIQVALDQAWCEGGCGAGFTCMSITIPSVSDPSQVTTRFGCAPVGSDVAGAIPTAAYAAPSRPAGSIDGLAPAVDPRLAGSLEVAVDQQQCEGGCGAGFTCMRMTVPSITDPSRTTTRFGCAPEGVDPLASAIPTSAVYRATSREAQPIVGLATAADPRLAIDVDVAVDQQQCDDGRSCGAGYTCLSMTVPSITDPGHTTTRYACAPSSPDAFACARAGLVLNTVTGACQKPVVASPGEACGPSRPGVVCAEAGRCVRDAQSATGDGVCVAASADGGECFADRSRGPGCMLPAYCARAPGAEVGTCRRPAPALCGE